MAHPEHDFTPITNQTRFEAALVYIAENSVRLSGTVLGKELGIDTVCFFTHSPDEYAFVRQAVLARGPVSGLSHGHTTYVDSDFTVLKQHILIFGVREPDETRPWIGYGDYPVTNYAELLVSHRDDPHVRQITSGRGRPLIELSHPDFDVLGFVVDQNEHVKEGK